MKVKKFLFQYGNFLKMTYLKNVVEVIYDFLCTAEIKIGVENVLEKKDVFFTMLFFSKNLVFSEKIARNHFWGSMVIFEVKKAYNDYYDKN